MGFFETVRDLVFPPCCVGCGLRMPPALAGKSAPLLCKDCAKDWEEGMLSQCPQCFSPYWECRCQPAKMKRAGSDCLLKLSAYAGAEESHAIDRVILRMKRKLHARDVQCCVKELAPILQKAVRDAEEKTPISHTVVLHLPRTRKNVRRYGFDQAAELSCFVRFPMMT